MTKRKGTGNFEQWQNVGKYYLRVSAPKTQCPGATSAPCMCELRRKPLPSRKRNRRSEAAAISVTLAGQNPYLIRRRRSADDVVTVGRDGVEDHLDQIAWRAGLFMVNDANTANDLRFFDQRQPPCSTLPDPGLFISHNVLSDRWKSCRRDAWASY